MTMLHHPDRPAPQPSAANGSKQDRPAASPSPGDPVWGHSPRYADQSTSLQTRLFGLGGVLFVCLAILAGALLRWPTSPAIPAKPTLRVFDMAPAAALPEPPSDVPPGPQQEQTEKPLPVPDRPPMELPEIQLPRVNPVPAPAAPPIPDPAPPVEKTTAPERQPAPPAPQASAGKQTWEGLVLRALNKARRYPRDAQRARQQGVPYIRFVMDREGRVLSVRLERSSGFTALDTEAVNLPRRAAPLPKPPADVRLGENTIELVVPVEFFLRR